MRKAVVVLISALSLVLGMTALADASAKPAYVVSLKTSVGSSTAGKFITVSGKVTGPGAAGKSVTIQRHYVTGGWTTVAFATIKSNGKYAARVETPQGGTTTFRAVKGKSSTRSAGASPARSIPVWAWLYLASQNGLYDGGTTPGVKEVINGASYPRSIVIGENTSANFKPDYQCTKLTTVVDYQYNSAAGPTESANLAFAVNPGNGGPIQPTTAEITIGTSRVMNVPLTGGKYLGISTVNMDSGVSMVLGDPKIYCNTDHLASWTYGDF